MRLQWLYKFKALQGEVNPFYVLNQTANFLLSLS